MPKMVAKLMTVPKSPYRLMYMMFWKNLRLRILYPSSNSIGGSRIRIVTLRKADSYFSLVKNF